MRPWAGDRAWRILRLVGAAVAGWLLVVAAVLRVGDPAGTAPLEPEGLVPVLLGFAALCVAGLTARRAPSVAWLGIIAALGVALVDLVGYGRASRGVLAPAAWIPMSGLASIGAATIAAVTAGYATEPGRRLGERSAWVIAGAAVIAIEVAGVVFFAIAGDPAGDLGRDGIGILGITTRVGLGAGLLILLAGVAGDLAGPVGRVRRRLSALTGPGIGRGPSLATIGAIITEELLPWRERARRTAVESERARLAAELHATVIPDLRRALSEAEAGGSIERLSVGLRATLDDVESLLAARRSIVLEELGLVRAIEWLAERTEERSTARVALEIPDPATAAADDPGDGARLDARPPRVVERAAFRVALLALDNVERHAPGAMVRVRLRVAREAVSLRISDDGPGFDPSSRLGGRGLADMRAEAGACGATLRLDASAGRGTEIAFDWGTD
jgi:signal transduction histidine kinase